MGRVSWDFGLLYLVTSTLCLFYLPLPHLSTMHFPFYQVYKVKYCVFITYMNLKDKLPVVFPQVIKLCKLEINRQQKWCKAWASWGSSVGSCPFVMFLLTPVSPPLG